MGKSDLALYIDKLGKKNGDISGIDGEESDKNNLEIDEEMLREMCKFSTLSNSNAAKLQGGFNAVCRPE